MAFLTSVAPYLGDGQPLNANFGESVADLVELERPDDGSDKLHEDIHFPAQQMPRAVRMTKYTLTPELLR